ncbi:hypothetical protein BG261_01230 [Floricoccus tropicus]|uniref:Nudix hydrolase domain-containing protein n=1 Tax=Floricoccus tropicus TaxID=1859473 RepID=A0A1E8GQN2_9LACT|nr:NUDIX domain-containing protein [Floricoccus tropicus]OFI50527.1 hypothetical protein BG261_01230 [Floricoccus tropicus]
MLRDDISFELDSSIISWRTAALINDGKRILLQRKINDASLAPIGGRVKVGETFEKALRREIKEEINLNLKIDRLLFVIENFAVIDSKRYQEISFIYNIIIDNKEFKYYQDMFVIDGIEFVWVKISDLYSNKISLKPEILNTLTNLFPNDIVHLINNDS